MTRVAEEVAVDRNRLAVDLVRPPCEIAIAGYRFGHIHRFGHGEGLPVVERFQRGQLVGVAFNQIGKAIQKPAAL